MNFELINRSINKVQTNQVQDKTLEEKLARELFKENKKFPISPQEKADILAMRLDPEVEQELSPYKLDRLKKINISNEELLASVIPNKEYFFLSDLRERKYSKVEDIQKLASEYNLSGSDLEKLRANGYLDWINGDEEREELIKRGFLSSLRTDEKLFLASIEGQEITSESLIKENLDLTGSRLTQLKIKGHIDILSHNEFRFLQDGGDMEKLSSYNLKKEDSYKLKYRTDETNIPNLGVKIDLRDKLDTTVKVYYRERTPLLAFRPKLDLGYEVKTNYRDISLYLRGISRENLTKRELDRFHEILATKDTSFIDFVPSNSELAFLQKIHGRKGDLELMLKIAQEDFHLPKDHVYHLVENNLISIKNGSIRNEWVEPNILNEARIWQSTLRNHSFENSIKLLSELKIQEPAQLIKGLLQENRPINPQQKIEDYEIFLKVNFKSLMNESEKNRLNHLRINGIHPELNTNFLKDDPSSWNMKNAKKQAFVNFFKDRYQVRLDIIEFVNKFKQVSHEQLLKLGLNSGEIDRYTRGVQTDKVPFGGKILNRHILNTPQGNIIYYSIHHEGTVSGRSLLETRIPKEEIAQRPQQRQDLLFHDLKVVDCVLETKKELENKGYKILEIKNEASQYASAKIGKSNNWRSDGPSFMDAILVVEEPINEALSLSGGTKSVAVEYGNYSNERMISKIENSNFDQAFVFSNQTFQQRYSKLEISQNVVFRSI